MAAAPPYAMPTNSTSIASVLANNGSIGVGFGGSGFLLFYYLGVWQTLQSVGILKPGHTRTAGSSGGAITSTSICSGFQLSAVYLDLLSLVNQCGPPEFCAQTLDQQLRSKLDQALPNDIHTKCSNVSFVQISVVNSTRGEDSGELVGTYTSREDLINTTATSAYVPNWSGNTSYTIWRGQKAYDGGYTNPLPCPPGKCPPLVCWWLSQRLHMLQVFAVPRGKC